MRGESASTRAREGFECNGDFSPTIHGRTDVLTYLYDSICPMTIILRPICGFCCQAEFGPKDAEPNPR